MARLGEKPIVYALKTNRLNLERGRLFVNPYLLGSSALK